MFGDFDAAPPAAAVAPPKSAMDSLLDVSTFSMADAAPAAPAASAARPSMGSMGSGSGLAFSGAQMAGPPVGGDVVNMPPQEGAQVEVDKPAQLP